MNSTLSVSIQESLAKASPRSDSMRLYYVAAAVVLLVATAIGFQQFYLHGRAFPGRDLLPAARPLLIAHGLAMTAWIVLFLVQASLVASGRRRLHMALGKFGAALAAAIVVLGAWVAILAGRHGPELIRFGLNRHQFLMVPLGSIALFAGYVTIGIWNRRRPAIHRPMLLLASLSIIAAATARIAALTPLYGGTWAGRTFGPFFIPLVLSVVFLALRWTLTRAFDRWHTLGAAAQAAAFALMMQVATTAAWGRCASWLLG